MEPAIDIAEAVVAALNAKEFALPFTSKRAYVQRRQTTSAGTLSVCVFLVDLDSMTSTRQDDDETHTVAIAVHQRVQVVGLSTVDPLVNLVRQIHNFCRKKTFAGAKVIRRKIQPRYDLEALATSQEFLSFVYLECKLIYTSPEADT